MTLTDETLNSTIDTGNYVVYDYNNGVLSEYGAYGILKVTKSGSYVKQEICLSKGTGVTMQTTFINRFGSIISGTLSWRPWYVLTAEKVQS